MAKICDRFERLIATIMSRRPVNLSRRLADGGSIPFVSSIQSKSRSSPLLSIGLVVVVIPCAFLSFHTVSLSLLCNIFMHLFHAAWCTKYILQLSFPSSSPCMVVSMYMFHYIHHRFNRLYIHWIDFCKFQGAILIIGYCYSNSGS